MKEYNFYVYILANPARTVYYTGFTNNLKRRLLEHIDKQFNPTSFAKKCNCVDLVYYEHFNYVNNAIAREKQIKRWRKEKKLNLIKSKNPRFHSYNNAILSTE